MSQSSRPQCIVIRTDHLGDLLLTTPLFHALNTNGFTVDVIVHENLLPILKRNPHVRAAYAMSDICPFFPTDWYCLANWLRRAGYSHIVLPYARPKELIWASAISNIPIKIAMWSGIWGRLTFHHCIRSGLPTRSDHMSKIMLKPAEFLDLPITPPDLVLNLEEAEMDEAKRMLETHLPGQKYIGIHPGSAGNSCNLKFATYRLLTNKIIDETDFSVIITGSSRERTVYEAEGASFARNNRVWFSLGELVTSGSDIRMLAAVISQLKVLVVSSTGPLQLAAALRIPTVSPFCSRPERSAKVWGSPYGRALVPPAQHCETWARCNSKQSCSLDDYITPQMLFNEAMSIVNAGS